MKKQLAAEFVLLAALWGSSFLFMRFGAAEFGAWATAGARVAVASIALLPVLLLSGGADPVTPPRHGERVAQALGPRARHLVMPQAGHGVMVAGCAPDLVHRFLTEEDEARALALDAACLARVPRPGVFHLPDPMAPAPLPAPVSR